MALSDTELILSSNNGDASAFEELVNRYDRRVLSLALKYTGSEDDAKDIYQEVFIRVYKGLKSFRFGSEFSTWLFRITTNVCLTAKSRSKKHLFVSIHGENENGEMFEIPANDSSYTELKAENLDAAERINSALETLPPKQKLSFVLKHFEGYKIKEIAEMLQCREGTVKKYLFDGIRKLRKELKDFEN